MARLVLCALALLVTTASSDPVKKSQSYKVADPLFAKRQLETVWLLSHIHEPILHNDLLVDVASWDLNDHVDGFSNVTALKKFADFVNEERLLPRGVPFSIYEPYQRFEAETLFHVLFSAKDYDTFFKTAVQMRTIVNEYMFVYVYNAALLHRHDTQGITIPPIYEVFPSFFHNGEIMTTAQRINTQKNSFESEYPSTFTWNGNVVIRWNDTTWPYFNEDVALGYYTHDHMLNAYYYNWMLTYPTWLGSDSCPLIKDKRGEQLLFLHKEMVARYYMERLSNGLGEIPELGLDVVQQGYNPGLVYPNGVPFPVRPWHYHLDQPQYVDDIIKITDYERRLRDAVEKGFYINDIGEQVNMRTPEAVDILGRLIEASPDSPNPHYYKDFIGIWKTLLGNSWQKPLQYYNDQIPLVVPSVLEQYQTTLRDPAFYMIWKRVLSIYKLWQEQLPNYKPEQLADPAIHIQKFEVDKMVTYFEHVYVNVTNHLFLNDHERETLSNEVKVLVQRPQLQHKEFEVRINVKSDVAKTVVVRLFLAPKYDSKGYEIPLHINTENFVQFDQFTYDLQQGETWIRRKSSENNHVSNDWSTSQEIVEEALKAVAGGSQFTLDLSQKITAFPQRLLLPKGRIGGMPFVMLAYISEYRAPKVPYGTGFDPALSMGLGSGARRWTDDPLGYPLDRPLWQWQLNNVHNLHIEDVTIYHKPIPDINVPNTE